ncbi:MAG: HAD family phosphatase [Candidatus Uhrbacteria bacterium]|nr:HAD family phosphatase [Candidatus Uhrbacteria bacterium]
MTHQFDFVLLDLGGVLVRLGGWDQLFAWTNIPTLDELKHQWLLSPAVHAFESGKCSEQEFADRLVQELSLCTSPAEFLASFEAAPTELFPGVPELLLELSSNIPVVSVSNTSSLHWRRFERWNFLQYFHRHLPSFELGVCKPNAAYFHRVLEELHVKPNRVLFFDDSVLNVDAAASVGIIARRTVGIDALRQELTQDGLIT